MVKKSVDTVICVSSDIEQGLRELLPGKVVVYVPSAVDTNVFRDYGISRRDQLIIVGRLVWRKGINMR